MAKRCHVHDHENFRAPHPKNAARSCRYMAYNVDVPSNHQASKARSPHSSRKVRCHACMLGWTLTPILLGFLRPMFSKMLRELLPSPTHVKSATIHNLPNEILAEIFLYGRDSQSSPRETVRYLASVSKACSWWRSVAITTALLWTSIDYIFPNSQHSITTFTRLSRYLARSKHASINVSAVFVPEDPDAARVWELIGPHMSRCRYAKFNCPGTTVAQMIPLLPKRLEKLTHFEWCAPPETDKSSPLLDAANASPMQSLTIFGPVGNSSLGNMFTEILPESLAQAPNSSWPEATKFLERCPAVKSVHIGFSQQNSPFPDEVSVIQNIADLFIIDQFPISIHHFVSTPNLRNLTIRGDGRLIASTHKVLQPSWPLLQTVKIEHMIFCVPGNLVPFFEANESITSLSITSCGQHIGVLLILLLGEMNDSVNVDITSRCLEKGPVCWRNDLLPSLRTLRLENCRSGYRSGQVGPALVGLLDQRPHLHIECDLRSLECTGFEAADFAHRHGDRFTVLGN